MDSTSQSRRVLFVGGPEDGRIEDRITKIMPSFAFQKGDAATELKVGQRVDVTSSRLLAAMNSLGTDKAVDAFLKLGVNPKVLQPLRYELTGKLEGFYVFRYAEDLERQRSRS